MKTKNHAEGKRGITFSSSSLSFSLQGSAFLIKFVSPLIQFKSILMRNRLLLLAVILFGFTLNACRLATITEARLIGSWKTQHIERTTWLSDDTKENELILNSGEYQFLEGGTGTMTDSIFVSGTFFGIQSLDFTWAITGGALQLMMENSSSFQEYIVVTNKKDQQDWQTTYPFGNNTVIDVIRVNRI